MSKYRCDAIGNGQRFFDSWGQEIRWVEDAGCWYVYRASERRWVASDEDLREMGKLTVEDMYAEGVRLTKDPNTEIEGKALLKWAKTTANSQFDRMLKMASSIPGVRVNLDAFDHQAYLINTLEDVWDLRTGAVYDGDTCSLLLSKRCNVAPKETWRGGLWEDFLNYIVPDAEIREFLQLCMGYMCFAGVEERVLLFLYGDTGCGKSKLVNAIQSTIGDYAVSLATDQLLIGAKDSYGLARLPGSRMIQAAEFEEGQKINTALVKRITSGEPVTVRMAYGKPFDYSPVGTIVISTNHIPWLGGDQASWSRVKIIPFNQPLEMYGVQDLDEKLKECRPEVLKWLIEGAKKYWDTEPIQGSKLVAPRSVIEAISEEKSDQRHYVLKFIEECFDGDRAIYQNTSDLYMLLKIWADSKGISEKDLVQQDWMGRRLREGGHLQWRTEKARRWSVGRLHAPHLEHLFTWAPDAIGVMRDGFRR